MINLEPIKFKDPFEQLRWCLLVATLKNSRDEAHKTI